MSAQSLLSHRNLYITLTAPIIGYYFTKSILSILAATSTRPKSNSQPIIHRAPSARMLTPMEEHLSLYPPDALPGGRNLSTPHGKLRVYEWGPENGRRILFVHGVSTPCIALAKMADLLVRKGCRVLLFDLPGRGYSDCSNPMIHRQDATFFCEVIRSVLLEAEGSWRREGFTLVGYSLGGGIAAAFTSLFPEWVTSLVLVAPGGILRRSRLSLWSRILYGDVLPDFLVEFLVERRLLRDSVSGFRLNPLVKLRAAISTTSRSNVDVTRNFLEELPDEDFDPYTPGQDSRSPIFDDRPSISPAAAVAWQLDAHPGFIPAFISSLKYAPIHDGRETWGMIGKRCQEMRTIIEPDHARGLVERKVLLILGMADNIITHEETASDAAEALGAENVEIVKLKGGHDVIISNAFGCVDAMLKFWGEC